TFLVQPFLVSGASMEPSFSHGDYLLVDELSYYFREPERGEVVVFRYPLDEKKFFIKRLIGLPGETLLIKSDGVYLNTNQGESKLSEPYAPNFSTAPTTITLGDKEYFVMGDNRPQSLDSRAWGPVSKKLLTGRVLLRLFPLDEIDLLPGATELSINQ
ncbi:MAG: signal peptidase I, partial [Patescibacteria group bacterium]